MGRDEVKGGEIVILAPFIKKHENLVSHNPKLLYWSFSFKSHLNIDIGPVNAFEYCQLIPLYVQHE